MRTAPMDMELVHRMVVQLYRESGQPAPKHVHMGTSPRHAALLAARSLMRECLRGPSLETRSHQQKRNALYMRGWRRSWFSLPRVSLGRSWQEGQEMWDIFQAGMDAVAGGPDWRTDHSLDRLDRVVARKCRSVHHMFSSCWNVLEHTLMLQTYRTFAVACEYPSVVRRDPEGRLHCEDGPSVEWADGFGIWYWHGTRVPEWLLRRRDRVTPRRILRIANGESRRAAIEIVGWERMLSGMSATVIDDDSDPQIGRLWFCLIPARQAWNTVELGLLEVECGTGRKFFIPVPPEMQTSVQAQCWIHQIPVADWVKPEVRG